MAGLGPVGWKALKRDNLLTAVPKWISPLILGAAGMSLLGWAFYKPLHNNQVEYDALAMVMAEKGAYSPLHLEKWKAQRQSKVLFELLNIGSVPNTSQLEDALREAEQKAGASGLDLHQLLKPSEALQKQYPALYPLLVFAQAKYGYPVKTERELDQLKGIIRRPTDNTVVEQKMDAHSVTRQLIWMTIHFPMVLAKVFVTPLKREDGLLSQLGFIYGNLYKMKIDKQKNIWDIVLPNNESTKQRIDETD
mmetsp:Transcript_22109/g.32892  ORF Transcript_22109/g.32892 Transcript_22109/m.32892 type:complete len:250 (+) Transcript_22109:11-760(+)